jgi:NAD(P)-dependent dehydrogenase (short-subunit alcohol dehydrogenase family)
MITSVPVGKPHRGHRALGAAKTTLNQYWLVLAAELAPNKIRVTVCTP